MSYYDEQTRATLTVTAEQAEFRKLSVDIKKSYRKWCEKLSPTHLFAENKLFFQRWFETAADFLPKLCLNMTKLRAMAKILGFQKWYTTLMTRTRHEHTKANALIAASKSQNQNLEPE